MSFMWYIQWIVHPISQLAFYRNEIQNSIVSYKRVSEIFGWFKSRRNLELKEIPLKKEIYLKKYVTNIQRVIMA